MGRCSLLVGLSSSCQSLDQLALIFREFQRISWRLQGAMSLTSSALDRLSADTQSGRSLTQMFAVRLLVVLQRGNCSIARLLRNHSQEFQPHLWFKLFNFRGKIKLQFYPQRFLLIFVVEPINRIIAMSSALYPSNGQHNSYSVPIFRVRVWLLQHSSLALNIYLVLLGRALCFVNATYFPIVCIENV